ncbi:MAG: hypothetical protein SVY10_04255 [Thermodesulfobacteriota bacterium]|nr:hypothetical protein [Thermodesulfobacteriota bacterium]
MSQIVRLELHFLYEIGRITVKPSKIINSLSRSIDLKISDCPFSDIVDEALKIHWTRDVFDRILTAEAKLHEADLITADENIRKHFEQAIWEYQRCVLSSFPCVSCDCKKNEKDIIHYHLLPSLLHSAESPCN